MSYQNSLFFVKFIFKSLTNLQVSKRVLTGYGPELIKEQFYIVNIISKYLAFRKIYI